MKTGRLQPWEVLETTDLYDGKPWIKLSVQQVALPDGVIVDDYYRLEMPDFVSVFAETNDGSVLVEKQYKHGLGEVSLMLPAGSIEEGETPLAPAQRELSEETGYVSNNWSLLGTFVLHGNYRGCLGHMFHARQASKVAEPDSGDLEEMEILLMKREQLIDAVRSGNITSMSVAALIALATNPLISNNPE